jgi:hypothetical protein
VKITVRDLLDLPPTLDVWRDDDEHEYPTAAELLEVPARSTAYRLAKAWPTTRVGKRTRVQTYPFLRDHLGVDLAHVTPSETDAVTTPVPAQ